MNGMTVVRWRKYGKDRLYVNGPADARLGWCDLSTGAITVADETDRGSVEATVAAWRAANVDAGPPVAPSPADVGGVPEVHSGQIATPEITAAEAAALAASTPVDASDWDDLASRRAGQAAREQALALKQAAPVRTFLARVLGVHTEERAWRIGADGEEKVAAQLAKLTKRNPRWLVLHTVPVGENGSDIDHVVIGPPGVHAVGVVVPVGAQDVTIKTAPDGVHVV